MDVSNVIKVAFFVSMVLMVAKFLDIFNGSWLIVLAPFVVVAVPMILYLAFVLARPTRF